MSWVQIVSVPESARSRIECHQMQRLHNGTMEVLSGLALDKHPPLQGDGDVKWIRLAIQGADGSAS